MKRQSTTLAAKTLLLAALTLLALAAGCGREEKQQAQVQKTAPLVQTQPAVVREVVYSLDQVGSLRSADRAKLRSQVAGTVAELPFKEGGDVKKGDVLVRLDDVKIRAEIRNLQARIEQLKVRLGFKEKTLERNRALLKRSAIPQHQFDQLASEVKETELTIAQAQADLVRLNELLTETVIRAPFDGVVGSKEISVGDYLKAGDPVVDVVVLDPLEISFSVPEMYKSGLSLGHKVSLRVAAEPKHDFQGEIFFVSPSVDEKTRTFLVKARVANPERRLNPGMFARVGLVTEVHPEAAVVPWSGVIQNEDETYIYLLENGKARKVPVRLGKVTVEWAEVLEPALPAGAAVITEGKFAARDGAEVRTAPAAPPADGGKG